MKKVMIGIGVFTAGVITGAVAMLVHKNIQFGKKSDLHEENYNNLNDLFRGSDLDSTPEDNAFETYEEGEWPDEVEAEPEMRFDDYDSEL